MRLSPPKSAIGGRIGQRPAKFYMRAARYNLSDIKVGDPVSHVDSELTEEGFSRTTMPGGGHEIKAGTTSIVYIHRDGRRARIELENGAIKTVEHFRMRPVTCRYAKPVRLGPDIHHKGELNKIAEKEHGRTYFELNDEQRHRILRQEKARGKTERQLLGSMQVQIVFRKNQPDHVKSKAEKDRAFISGTLYKG